MSNTNNQENQLAAYKQKMADATQAALSSSTTKTEITSTTANDEERQWRNLSDPNEYEKWEAERRDKPEDWKRYKDERLGGALSGATGLSEKEQENQRREYWKAKDALRGLQTSLS